MFNASRCSQLVGRSKQAVTGQFTGQVRYAPGPLAELGPLTRTKQVHVASCSWHKRVRVRVSGGWQLVRSNHLKARLHSHRCRATQVIPVSTSPCCLDYICGHVVPPAPHCLSLAWMWACTFLPPPLAQGRQCRAGAAAAGAGADGESAAGGDPAGASGPTSPAPSTSSSYDEAVLELARSYQRVQVGSWREGGS